jgi:hypothetical protein
MDERIRLQLARKEKTDNMVRNYRHVLDKSLSNLDDHYSRSRRANSP